ncbi:hypothetical protein LX36DRAFT_653232 [Colletotrichum falcatum]|nr:hypothetical protein LX36DRAFT_653232 [Colletotrichum falcatum]
MTGVVQCHSQTGQARARDLIRLDAWAIKGEGRASTDSLVHQQRSDGTHWRGLMMSEACPTELRDAALQQDLDKRSYMWHHWEPEKKAAGCMTAGQSSGSRRPRPDGKVPRYGTRRSRQRRRRGKASIELHEKGEGCPLRE